MARSLNKQRMIQSRVLVIAAFALAIFTQAWIAYDGPVHEAFDYIGSLLIAVCALGRLYATVFLGGHKNDSLITHGPFSVVRNPLYFFSLLGVTGIAMITGHVLIMIVLPTFFIFMYHHLMLREEAFLREKFGAPYKEYCKKTPRIIPNLKLYNAPEQVLAVPKYVNKAFADAIWWFAAFPVLELIELLQREGVLKPLFYMP